MLSGTHLGRKAMLEVAMVFLKPGGTPETKASWKGMPAEWEEHAEAGPFTGSKQTVLPMDRVSSPLLFRAVQGDDLIAGIHPLRKYIKVTRAHAELTECLYHGTFVKASRDIQLRNESLLPGNAHSGRATLLSPFCPEDCRQDKYRDLAPV